MEIAKRAGRPGFVTAHSAALAVRHNRGQLALTEPANPFTDWPTADLATIYRDFGPDDLRDLIAKCGVDDTILIQAAPSLQESLYCLAIAERCDFVKGVVGWIDFEAADALDQLERLAGHSLLKGLRPMVQSNDEPGWLLRDEFAPIFEAMIALGLRFDGLVRHTQIGDLDLLAKQHPGLPIVLDHGGKPPLKSRAFDGWATDILGLAENPNVFSKISGLWTEAADDTSAAAISPWVNHLLVAFGTERLMWGSDWPVLELAGSYPAWLAQCERILGHLSEEQRANIFDGNGRRFYGVA